MTSPPRTRPFGERIRALRHQKGLSIANAARAARVGARTWARWEAGRASPDIHKAARLARALGVGLEQLVGESEAGDAAASVDGK